MHDAQSCQPGGGLLSQHGGSVVGHQSTRQAALHESLAQGMDQALRRLIQIPLQVAHQAGAVVDHAQDHGGDPLPQTGQNFTRAMVEVQVPKGIDVIHLEAAYLQAFEPVARCQGTGRGTWGAGLAEHALGQEVAAYGWVGGARRRRGRRMGRSGGCAATAGQGGTQVVKVQLCRPARMLAVLPGQRVDDGLRQAGEAFDTTAQAIAQCSHGVIGCTGQVIPALQRGVAKADIKTGRWMAPGLGGKLAQGALQFTRRRGCGQQGADDDEAQSR